MQIDWISALIETPPHLAPGYDSGRVLRIDPGGEVVSRKAAPLDLEAETEGSGSRAFRVFTPQPNVLYLSGNPVKLLQGHNLFGSCDIPALYLEAGSFVREQVGLFPSPGTFESCEFSLPRFTRIDVTRSYRFDSVAAAQSYIRYVAGAARSRHGAATLYKSETAIFGEGSRRWSLKIYDKFSEMEHQRKRAAKIWNRLRPGAHSEAFSSELMDWSRGVVRFEVTLRSPELEDLQPQLIGRATSSSDANVIKGGDTYLAAPPSPTLPRASNSSVTLDHWPEFAHRIWEQYYRRITFNENAIMSNGNDLLENALSKEQRRCLGLWRASNDLRTLYSKAQFYRHRSALLSVVGVDIASPPPAAPVEVAASTLDPAGWDPEPIQSRLVEPRASLKDDYKLI